MAGKENKKRLFGKEGWIRSNLRDAYGDLSGGFGSDLKTIITGGVDLATGGNKLKKEVGTDVVNTVKNKLKERREAKAAKRAAARRGEGFDLPGGHPANRHRGPGSSTGVLGVPPTVRPEINTYELEKKAKGGMAKKASAKKTSAKKTATRRKPRGVGVAKRGYGRAMR